MDALSFNLILAAVGLAVTHTALGPDHVLPFVMLARARHWGRSRTLLVTLLCGVGHVASSVLLGMIGVALGYGVAHIEAVEGIRGDWAAWGLVAFGFAYALWGVRVALRRRAGIVPHHHLDVLHLHVGGGQEHDHAGRRHPAGVSPTTFWTLFAIFVLGPCEPLIPLFVLPASRGNWGLALVTGIVFGAVTVGTMMVLVALALAGVERLPLGALERWSHAMAGGVITASGLAVIFLGL